MDRGQACLRRGLRLQWVTVRLTNCGLPAAHLDKPSQIVPRFHEFRFSQANRARTFLMAVRPESAVLQAMFLQDFDSNKARTVFCCEVLLLCERRLISLNLATSE